MMTKPSMMASGQGQVLWRRDRHAGVQSGTTDGGESGSRPPLARSRWLDAICRTWLKILYAPTVSVHVCSVWTRRQMAFQAQTVLPKGTLPLNDLDEPSAQGTLSLRLIAGHQ